MHSLALAYLLAQSGALHRAEYASNMVLPLVRYFVARLKSKQSICKVYNVGLLEPKTHIHRHGCITQTHMYSGLDKLCSTSHPLCG